MRSIHRIKKEIASIPGVFLEGGDPFREPRIHSSEADAIENMGGGEGLSGSSLPHIDLVMGNPELVNDPVSPKQRQQRFDEIGEAVNESGIEALAWYTSFHFTGSAWGIFIPASSLYYLEERVFKSASRARGRRLQLALRLLLEHELFHFSTDYAVAQWEIISGSPLWGYMTDQRKAAGGIYLEQEEKMANAYMLRRFGQNEMKGAVNCAKRFVRGQPSGYRDGEDAIPDGRFDEGLAELLRYYLGVLAVRKDIQFLGGGLDLCLSFPLGQRLDPSFCPIHIIPDQGMLGMPPLAVKLITRIPRIVETKGFLKSLAKLHPDIQKQWSKKKAQLAVSVPTHPKFEKFNDGPPPVFSIRLPRGHRAHLSPVEGEDCWQATSVGSHAAMGHGK